MQGLSREATTFYDYMGQLAFGDGKVPTEAQAPLKKQVAHAVKMLQDTIGVLDFWRIPVEVRRLRGNIDTEIQLAGIPALDEKHERIAVEIVKLAERRHGEITR